MRNREMRTDHIQVGRRYPPRLNSQAASKGFIIYSYRYWTLLYGCQEPYLELPKSLYAYIKYSKVHIENLLTNREQ